MLQPDKRLIWILLGVYVMPVAIYVMTFGWQLSIDHQRWAEFGSAMSGIYAPIVAVTTLAVLLVQIGLQKQINDHSYNQSHFAQARADIEFYAVQLAEKLNQVALPGMPVRSVLHSNFQPRTAVELDDAALRVVAANVDAAVPGLLGMWSGIYPILTGLAAIDEATYRMTLTASIQKLIALLSFETCVALDNFYRVRTEGRLSVAYRFSPLLREAKSAA